MKSVIFKLEKYCLSIIAVMSLVVIFSCNNLAKYESNSEVADSSAAERIDTLSTLLPDSASKPNDTLSGHLKDTLLYYHVERPDILIKKPKRSTGTALVYCPSTMLKGIPAIINATISKDELSKALSDFKDKIAEENPETKKEQISSNIRSNQISIYDQMGVTIEYDPEDFKELSKDENESKSFGEQTALEWEWYLKPLHTTRRSIINFKFYYVNPEDNTRNYLLEKTISVAVRVDPRSYVDQWRDFLLGDPKNTTTAIIIPLVTFLGGFFTGRKKKKDS